MSKYQYKQRLKRYLFKYGEVDALTRWLILDGEHVDEPSKALEPFVEQWEGIVSWYENSPEPLGGVCSEEYYFDLDVRSMLDSMIELATDEQLAPYRERIRQADELFKQGTMEAFIGDALVVASSILREKKLVEKKDRR